MLTAIDRQYPGDEDKRRFARQLLAQVFELADEAAQIAAELEAQTRAAGLGEAFVFMLEGVPVMVRKAREAAQRRDWEELNLWLDRPDHGGRDARDQGHLSHGHGIVRALPEQARGNVGRVEPAQQGHRHTRFQEPSGVPAGRAGEQRRAAPRAK
jgi:hypothetical protein